MNRTYPLVARALRPASRRLPTAAVGAALLLLGLTGCESVPDRLAVDPLTPSYKPTNVAGPDYLPIEVRRVAILPAWSTQPLDGRSLDNVDQAFVNALTRAARFETVPVSRDDLRSWVKQPAVGSTSALPANLFTELRAQTGADAVLFIDVTTHSAYPPLALGLRTRLVRLDTGATLWATDELFDASRATAAAGARRHHLQGAPQPADLSPTVLQSPARFAAYAADTLVGTLPSR